MYSLWLYIALYIYIAFCSYADEKPHNTGYASLPFEH